MIIDSGAPGCTCARWRSASRQTHAQTLKAGARTKLNTASNLKSDPLDNIKLSKTCTVIESPNFILNKDKYKEYRKKTDKFFFNSFYMWGKKQINVLPGIKSQDKDNRKLIPKNTKIPGIPTNSKDKKYINEAIKYIDKNFPDNYGNTQNFIFPISHSTAKKFINHFIKYKLNNFGNYQDAVVKEEQYLFHSLLSSSINIGLINPDELINKIINPRLSQPLGVAPRLPPRLPLLLPALAPSVLVLFAILPT